MPRFFRKVIGPRVPAHVLEQDAGRYRAPKVLFWLARLALLVSLFMPYWQMTLHAPQYPDNLHVKAYVNHLVGDIREIDSLNHYIGMRPLEEAAQLERSLAIVMIIALMLLVEGAVLVRTKWAALLVLPTILFPVFFLLDLYLWMNHFGQNLDPKAALSGAIKPFTPPILGVGWVGQFKTVALPGLGLILAFGASLLSIAGLWFHRRAYKPLAEQTAQCVNGDVEKSHRRTLGPQERGA